MSKISNRRGAIKKIVGATTALTAVSSINAAFAASDAAMGSELKGKVNHSVCRWCYNSIDLEELCKASKDMGIQSVEIIGPKDFPMLQKYDLSCGMVMDLSDGYGITKGWNKKENHEPLVEMYKYLIDETAKAGFKNVICFSGNRDATIGDEQGLLNCAEGLKKVINYAENKKVNLVMELLNSKVNHPNYMCDLSTWGVELCDAIGSDNFKLLYDIYHMQIMEGDVIATIRKNQKYYAHYHTGGVPGRNEIDETQELYYPAIMQAIVDTGYKGYVGQEFVPKRADKLASLRQGVNICDI
ncbi:MAG: hydroxypyruvate isomerase [Spirosomataceae bacterium]|jgi:hydroxypyruvate isomerase